MGGVTCMTATIETTEEASLTASVTGWRQWARVAYGRLLGRRPFRVPEHLAVRHRPLDSEGRRRVSTALHKHYFASPVLYEAPAQDYLATPAGREDLHNHLEGRLQQDRVSVVPWLDHLKPLDGARVLEIGCGTGASTVALGEQGASVVGVDLHDAAVRVAEERCRAYGVEAQFHTRNAVDALEELLADERFDFIIFFAVLEHMTLDERLTCIEHAWAGLRPGSQLVVVDTPNRLWYFDAHTARLPFFMWLDDDLAFRYSQRSPREVFNELFRESNAASAERFARWGRGVSYHEFELALDLSLHDFPPTSCMTTFLDPLPRIDPLRPWRRDRKYLALLREIAPEAYPTFLLPWLNLSLEKPGR